MAESDLTPALLRHKYWKEGKTQIEISKEIGVSRSQISSLMIKWHIPTRSASERASKFIKHWWETATEAMRKERIKHAVLNQSLKFRSPFLQRPLTELEKGYLAALIDGEGSIFFWFLPNKQICSCIVIGNTSKTLLRRVQKIIGGYIKGEKPRGFMKKIYYRIIITKVLDVYNTLKQVAPLLIVKKEKAELMLEFLEKRMAQKTWFYTKEQLAIVSKFRLITGNSPLNLEGYFCLKMN